MATPVLLTNWSHQTTPTQNGGGICNTLNGTGATIDTAILTPQALKIVVSAVSSYLAYTQVNGAGETVGRVYVYFPTSLPTSNFTVVLGVGADGSQLGIRFNSTNGLFEALQVGGTAVSGPAVSANTLYRIDFKMKFNSTTHSIDWQINGADQTQYSVGTQTNTTFTAFRVGAAFNTTGTCLFQHLLLSVTPSDYPIGPGGTKVIVPSADGTHNSGTNVMEDNAGADIGVTTAYDKINSIPPSSSSYIRQAANGTGNYAEVLFGDLVDTPDSIHGAMATLAYTSETTTANRGACIVSKDSFSTSTTVWGNPTTTADYSDGSTSNLFWKSAIIAGVVDLSTANALKARVGFSDDATPDPYWIGLIVEVAYSLLTDIQLDLATYSSTIHDITVQEHENIPLDLVTYSSTINDINVTENINVSMDLVTYASVVNDVVVLENEAVLLDLVVYSSSENDIVVLESELVLLDLATYSSTINDITVQEHENISLDLVTYSTLINDISLLESGDIILDLVVCSSTINDVTVQEHENIPLDLITYSIAVNDITVQEHENISLDLVTHLSSINDVVILESENSILDLVVYSSAINDINLLESDDIPLDLVSYLAVVNDISVLENEMVSLELTTYSSSINDIAILENEAISLDLAMYTRVVYDVLLVDQIIIPTTPINRIYAIVKENRTVSIEGQDRTFAISKQDRTI